MFQSERTEAQVSPEVEGMPRSAMFLLVGGHASDPTPNSPSTVVYHTRHLVVAPGVEPSGGGTKS